MGVTFSILCNALPNIYASVLAVFTLCNAPTPMFRLPDFLNTGSVRELSPHVLTQPYAFGTAEVI